MRPGQCFSYGLPHAEHETTIIGVVLCLASLLHPTTCRTRNDTPIGVVVWLASFLPLTTCQAQNHTLVGVVLRSASFLCLNHTLVGVNSLSDPFLAPRSSFEGCSLMFYIILNYYCIYLIQCIKSPREYCGNPIPVYAGREFGGYRCGSAKNTPRDTRVHH